MSAVEELDRRFGIPGVARICKGNGGLPLIQITGSCAEGEMYLHGAQVTSWKPAEYDQVLFLSTKSRWATRSAEEFRFAFRGFAPRQTIRKPPHMDLCAQEFGSSSLLLKMTVESV